MRKLTSPSMHRFVRFVHLVRHGDGRPLRFGSREARRRAAAATHATHATTHAAAPRRAEAPA